MVGDVQRCTLEFTTSLESAVWRAVGLAAVLMNGFNTVTNADSGTRTFCRLIN